MLLKLQLLWLQKEEPQDIQLGEKDYMSIGDWKPAASIVQFYQADVVWGKTVTSYNPMLLNASAHDPIDC